MYNSSQHSDTKKKKTNAIKKKQNKLQHKNPTQNDQIVLNHNLCSPSLRTNPTALLHLLSHHRGASNFCAHASAVALYFLFLPFFLFFLLPLFDGGKSIWARDAPQVKNVATGEGDESFLGTLFLSASHTLPVASGRK
jgi:hypothetical protein